MIGEEPTFLQSSVQPMGVTVLHHDRLAWIRESVEASGFSWPRIRDDLAKMSFFKDNTRPLPGHVKEYLINVNFPADDKCSDRRFLNDYGGNLWENTIKPVKGLINTTLTNEKSLLFLLCGGGSKHPLYRRFIDNMEKQRAANKLALDPIRLEHPSGMHCPKCPSQEYHRLSVAYGLAHWELGEIIRESNINEIEVIPERHRYRELFISKDHV